MSIDAEGRRARARLAATRRHHPDVDTTELETALERGRINEHIAALVASWHHATPEQKARLRRLYSGAAT